MENNGKQTLNTNHDADSMEDLKDSGFEEQNLSSVEVKPPILSTEMNQPITPVCTRLFILFLTLLENLIYSGIIFGWPALFYMLKNEKIYEHLCVLTAVSLDSVTTTQPSLMSSSFGKDENVSSTTAATMSTNPTMAASEAFGIETLNCGAQENVLNLAYTIGIFSMGFTSFLWGFMLEAYGLRFVRIALNILISIGCLMLAIATKENPTPIIIAIILLGLIGVPLRIANMQIADYFPQMRSTVITIFSGAFSASPVVFVFLKYFYDTWHLSYFAATGILFVVSVIVLPFSTSLLPKHSVRKRETKLLNRWENYRTAIFGLQTKKPEECVELMEFIKTNQPRFIKKNMMVSVQERVTNNQVVAEGDMDNLIKSVKGPRPVIVKASQMGGKQTTSSSKLAVLLKMLKGSAVEDEIPLRVSLLSFSFLMHQLWFSWLNTYMVLYSGSMALWLARVTEDEQGKRHFTQAFGLVQVSALLFAPIAGAIMDRSVAQANRESNLERRRLLQARSGFVPILITTLTLTCAVVCRFFDTPTAVYTSLLFITLLRSFLIAVASAYIRVRFPASHFNRLNGIMCTTGAFFSLLQFPLFYFESKSEHDAFYVNGFCAIMTALSMLNPLCLGLRGLQQRLLESEQRHGRRLKASHPAEA